MPWQTSDRRDHLPSDWAKIRKRIGKRDQWLCQAKLDDGTRCLEPATDVDHIRPGDDHRDSNLECLCGWHHRKKSSREGGSANGAKRRANRQRFRRHEGHPAFDAGWF